MGRSDCFCLVSNGGPFNVITTTYNLSPQMVVFLKWFSTIFKVWNILFLNHFKLNNNEKWETSEISSLRVNTKSRIIGKTLHSSCLVNIVKTIWWQTKTFLSLVANVIEDMENLTEDLTKQVLKNSGHVGFFYVVGSKCTSFTYDSANGICGRRLVHECSWCLSK